MSIFNPILIDDIIEEGYIILQLKDEHGIKASHVWEGIANHVYKEYYILEAELANCDIPKEELEYWAILNEIFFELVNEHGYQKMLVANIVFALSTGYIPVGIPRNFIENIYRVYNKYTEGSEIFAKRGAKK